MKKTNIFITIIVIALIIGTVYISTNKILSTLKIGNPALKLTISTDFNQSNGMPYVTNIIFEQTRVIYKGSDAIPDFPDISVTARNESLLADPVTYWASEPRSLAKNETHTLTLTFLDSYTPKTNDTLILTIRFTGTKGSVLTKNTAFYEWK